MIYLLTIKGTGVIGMIRCEEKAELMDIPQKWKDHVEAAIDNGVREDGDESIDLVADFLSYLNIEYDLSAFKVDFVKCDASAIPF